MTHRENEDKAGKGLVWTRIWLGVLAVAALYGIVEVTQAADRAASNEILATGAPQQSVVGLWHLADLNQVVIYEIIVLVMAVITIGIMIASRLVSQGSSAPGQPGPVEGRRPETLPDS